MILRRLLALGGVILLILSILPSYPAAAAPVSAALLSIDRITHEAGGSYAAVSSDGRYVVYESVGERGDGAWNVYVYDRQTGTTEVASLGINGSPSENPGDYTSPPAISSNGMQIAFMSQASNLVNGDTNGMPDIFVRDRARGANELVTVARDGGLANGPSWNPAISADGRFVAFQSHASNLVKGDTNDSVDIFVRDRQLKLTELVSVTDAGQQGTDYNDYGFSSISISADGRFVAFSYENLPVDQPGEGGSSVYLRDRQAGTTRRIAAGTYPALSSSGRYLAFVSPTSLLPIDKNGAPDVYLFDRQTSTYERVSVSESGKEPNNQWVFCAPAISSDGRYVTFETTAALVANDDNSLSDVYLRDRQAGKTRLVTAAADGRAGDGESHNPTISDDGSLVAFNSMARNLAPSNTERNHVFVRPFSGFILSPDDKVVFLPMVIGQ
jgi:Tol biopolymer transport system component